MQLTGKTRHRLSSFGKKLILQVEIKYIQDYNYGRYIESEERTSWFDATIEQLQELQNAGINP